MKRSTADAVAAYYEGKLAAHGAAPRGVDWNGPDSQALRFRQLARLLPERGPFSLNDVGCGYGALLGHLRRAPVRYRGYDLSAAMIDAARRRHRPSPKVHFFQVKRLEELRPADYSVASGVFHVKLNTPNAVWKRSMLESLRTLDRCSRKGFAFNALTIYSDRPKMRPHLYYADPRELFDYCKRHFSRNIALLHDYGLYEFTVLVRKDL